jgi:hypothetical protein
MAAGQAPVMRKTCAWTRHGCGTGAGYALDLRLSLRVSSAFQGPGSIRAAERGAQRRNYLPGHGCDLVRRGAGGPCPWKLTLATDSRADSER